VAEKKRAVWSALVDTQALELMDDVLTIGFPSLHSAEVLKKLQGPGLPVNAELVRDAILSVTGHRVRFKVHELVAEGVEAEAETPEHAKDPETASWPTVSPPADPGAEGPVVEAEHPAELVEPDSNTPAQGQIGEAVIREILGGELISEHPVAVEDER
jgi:hypothetical protein